MPLTRLDEKPLRRGTLADLTCDSDGRVDVYVDSEGLDVSLPLHDLRRDEPYRLGIFLVGAYQETLGDIHMLLDYVGYRPDDLRAAYRARIAAADIHGDAAKQVEAALEAGLTGYTYLAESN